MATEENDLDELQAQMERVVGPGPAKTLMRHLSPTPWPDVATKADLAAVQAAVKADLGEVKADVGEVKADVGAVKEDAALFREEVRDGFNAVGNRFVQFDAAMQVGFSNLEASLIQRINAQTITMIFALAVVVASISSVALFR